MREQLPVAIPILDNENEPIIVTQHSEPEPVFVRAPDKCAIYLRCLSLIIFIIAVVMLIKYSN